MTKFISLICVFCFINAQDTEVIKTEAIYTLAETGYILDINFVYESNQLVKKQFNKKSVNHKLILEKSGSTLFEDKHTIDLGDDWNTANNEYFDRFKLNVPPAEYRYTIQVTSDDAVLFETTKNIQIPEISDNTFLSSLTIFNSLKKWADGNEIFKYFNFYEGDISFSKSFVIGKNNAMFWYFEIYNLPETEKKVSVAYRFFDVEGKLVREEKKMLEYTSRDLPVLDFYNVIAKLGDGKHRFEIDVNVGSFSKKITTYITIIKEQKKSDIVDYSMINFDVDQFVVLYRLEGNELDFFENLDKDSKLKYIKTYFDKLIEVQKISYQQLRKSIDDMADFVRINYGAKFSNYLKSDMAKVLFKYGTPTHIERVYSDPDYREYEVWHYDYLITGVKFYFADPEQLGMRILHADHQKMGYWNPDWKRRILKSAGN